MPIIGDMISGTHVCAFYEVKQDAPVASFKVGLEAGVFCIWALSEPITEQAALALALGQHC